MPRASRVGLARFVEPLLRVLAHGFEHRVALAFGLHDNQRFFDEAGQQVEHVHFGDRAASAHRFGCFERQRPRQKLRAFETKRARRLSAGRSSNR